MTAPTRHVIRADWVVPISSPPVRDGAIVVEAGRIVAVGEADAVLAGQREFTWQGGQLQQVVLAGGTAVLPALVNAHTHLELSWLQGRLTPGATMAEWARQLVRTRRAEGGDEVAASAAGAEQLRRAGVGVVGDVSNSLASPSVLAERGVRAVVFHELIGFSPADAEAEVTRAIERARDAARPGVDVTLSAHAPYSVAPALFKAIRRGVEALGTRRWAVHLAESADELRLLRDGTGPWRDLLEDLGVWNGAWVPPGCGPVEWLDRVGFLGQGLNVVHAVHCTRRELDRLAEVGASVVACPRSNARLGVGTPPVRDFFAAGLNVAVGSDSLASNDDLGVFGEVRELRRLAPEVPARRLLACVTINGARALGVDADHGSIDVGKRAALIAVGGIGTGDVEERLVNDGWRSAIEWVAV